MFEGGLQLYIFCQFMEQCLGLMSKIEEPSSPQLKKYSSAQQKTNPSLVPSSQNLSVNNPETGSTSINYIKTMKKKVESIELQQSQLHNKCRQIVEQLMKQIEVKQKKNNELEHQVLELRQELQTSREDFSIIVQYLNRRKMRENKPFKLKNSKMETVGHLDSTKDSGRLQKQISGLKVVKKVGSGSNIANYQIRSSRDGKGTTYLRKNKSDLFDL